MSISVRAMRREEANDVAALVQGLAQEIRPHIKPKLTGTILNQNADLIDVVIAEEAGRVIGACLGLMTFSTWRAAKGLYIVDLFVSGEARNRGVGLDLLRESARRARKRGAGFVKLEVDHVNDGAARFYERLGFARHDEDRLFVLEEEGLVGLISSPG
jgi:ribosomal protein S18 acetylase RimI-like enzyme